jgi:hypothetical protein
MEESHKNYINKKLADALIHHHFAKFGKSHNPKLVPDEKLKYYRLGFSVIVLIALIL